MSIIKRLKARLIRSGLAVCAAVVAVIGVGFLVAAAYIALARVLTPLLTAVVFGVGWLLIALIVWLISRAGGGRRREKARPPPEEDLAAVLGVLLGGETRDWMRDHGDKATVAALVAGAVLGASPPLQRLVSKLARAAAAGARRPPQ